MPPKSFLSNFWGAVHNDRLFFLLNPNEDIAENDSVRIVDAVVEAYVKYNRFHLEQRPRYKPNPFHHDNFAHTPIFIARESNILA